MRDNYKFRVWRRRAPGRDQLVPAIAEIAGKQAVVESHILFRIDTSTGKTWTYVAGQEKDGKLREFWSQINENPQ